MRAAPGIQWRKVKDLKLKAKSEKKTQEMKRGRMSGKKEVLVRDQTREYLVRAGGGRSLEREEKGQGQG